MKRGDRLVSKPTVETEKQPCIVPWCESVRSRAESSDSAGSTAKATDSKRRNEGAALSEVNPIWMLVPSNGAVFSVHDVKLVKEARFGGANEHC